jgi:RNA polymerase sigma-70 factor (ECF subfamily)
MSRSPDSAEDLYQEVWRKIIESRERYRPNAKFTTFLYRVAYNCFVDHTRRNKRYSTADFIDVSEGADDAEGPDAATEKLIFRRRFNAAIARLPDEQRHAFLLHEEAGLGLDCIAKISGTSRETVKSRLRYANNKLKQTLLVGEGARWPAVNASNSRTREK